MALTFTWRKAHDADDPHPPFDLRVPGADYCDLTTADRVADALALGRIERVHLIPPCFGGSSHDRNLVCAAPGATAALEWVEQRVYDLLKSGRYVTYRADVTWKGASRVPATLSVDTGQDVVTLRFW
jgi:hypothetical protein